MTLSTSEVASGSHAAMWRTYESPPVPETVPTSLVGVLPVHHVRLHQAAGLILDHIRQKRSTRKALRVFGVNAQIATLAGKDARFAQAMLAAELRFPDGISIVLASRLLGCPLPERVAGGELMELLCHQAAKEGLSAYFFGGLAGAADTAAEILQGRHPGLKVAGTSCPPYGFEHDAEMTARIREDIRSASPDLLFVAFGVPKQEIWMWENCPTLPVGMALAVGAAFDTTAGLRKRAPEWARKTGTEWLYRLVMEPRRLWRRYLIGNVEFTFMILRQWMRKEEKAMRAITN